MKLNFSLFVFAVILIVPTTLAQTPARAPWNLYTVKGERISIALPVLPALQTFKQTRTSSKKDYKRNVISCSVNRVLYTIHLVENSKPPMTLDAFIQEQTTAYLSDNLAPANNLIFERDLTVDGIAGKAFLYPDNKGMVQFFADNKRLYDIRAYGAPVDDPRIATFFQHLSLKKQDGAIEVSEAVQSGSFDITPGTIVSGKEVDTKVRLISKPEPTYTDKARDKWITGTVVLKAIFAADGRVTNIRVVQGLRGGLTEQAIEVARKIKFVPATKNGKNVSMWLQLEYNFNLYR
jgi:TonB family protein